MCPIREEGHVSARTGMIGTSAGPLLSDTAKGAPINHTDCRGQAAWTYYAAKSSHRESIWWVAGSTCPPAMNYTPQNAT